MPAGGKIGNKGGGRKKFEVEIANLKHRLIKEATEEALINLARSQVYKHLSKDYLTIEQIKEIGLPIALKSIKIKKDITSCDKPLPILSYVIKEDEKS